MKSLIIIAICAATALPQGIVFTSMPKDLQFFGRDMQDSAIVTIAGNVTPVGTDSVSVTVYKSNAAHKRVAQLPVSGAFSLAVKIHAELASYKFEVRLADSLVAAADSVLCGDAYMADGQSNTDYGVFRITSPWLRTFGYHSYGPDSGWFNLGEDPWKVGSAIIAQYHVPLCFIIGSVGGSQIISHQPGTVIYNAIYNRIYRGGLQNHIRGVFWHQGEYDAGDTLTATVRYDSLFRAMYDGWKRDYPSIEHVYIFQTQQATCSGLFQGLLRDTQRRIPSGYTDVSVMSTAGITENDGCHYAKEGYEKMGQWLSRLVLHDLYGSTDTVRITAPDIRGAWFEDGNRTRLKFRFTHPVAPSDTAMKDYILLDGKAFLADSLIADTANSALTLVLKSPSRASRAAYTPSKYYPGTNTLYRGPWLFSTRGVAALTFWNFPIPLDSFLLLDTSVISFYSDQAQTPVIRLVNTGSTVPALTAMPDSSWLKVSVTGTGNSQILHHAVEGVVLEAGKTYEVKVSLTAAGYKPFIYAVVVRGGMQAVSRMALDPASPWCVPSGQAKLAVRAWDAYGESAVADVEWSVSGGGVMDSMGLFQSSGETGVFDVGVRLKSDTSVSATGTITVSDAPLLPFVRRINFQPDTVPWREGWLADKGANYDTGRGYGWLGAYLTGTFNNRNGDLFLLKSFIQAKGVWHCDAPDNDYIIKTAMGDNAWGSQAVCVTRHGNDTLCLKPAGTLNTIRTDTITVSDGKGIDLDVSGAFCYLVIIAKNGVDMEMVADDGVLPMGADNGVGANNYSPLQMTAAPNPFNPSTIIMVNIPGGSANLTIYAINGKVLRCWPLKAGNHRILWDGKAMSSGCYLLSLKLDSGEKLTRKVMLLK